MLDKEHDEKKDVHRGNSEANQVQEMNNENKTIGSGRRIVEKSIDGLGER